MMIKKRLASSSAQNPIEAVMGAIEEIVLHRKRSSNQLRAPTVDERAALYLRAVHEKHDFTNEEHSRARDLILDAMAADIISKIKPSRLESVPDRRPLQPHLPLKGMEPDAPISGIWLSDSVDGGNFQAAVAPREFYQVSDQFGKSAESTLARVEFTLPRQRAVAASAFKRAKRSLSICGAMAIAAAIASFLITAVPTSWFATNPNSFGPQVAMPAPPLSLDIKAELSAPKQVETMAARRSTVLTLDNDTLRILAPAEEIADLLKRGRELVAAHDIPAARLLLERAAEAGDASAALELGATYDPIVLKEYSGMTIAPDIAKARTWYQTAKVLGSAEASKRLERLVGADR
jgi:hypothetical protein